VADEAQNKKKLAVAPAPMLIWNEQAAIPPQHGSKHHRSDRQHACLAIILIGRSRRTEPEPTSSSGVRLQP